MASETLADIVAEMRGMGKYQQYTGSQALRLADRIEEAWRSEREDEFHRGAEAREKFIYAVLGKPSNAAVLREALVQIVALARQDQPRFAIISTAETALSALPRQCDIGTAEEQCQRMFHYCIKKGNCSVCKRRKNMSFRGCILDWAQMPYEEGGAK